MQTERVTFLTSPDHKAALDAFARESGHSVGHVLREASTSYIAPPLSSAEEEAELDALTGELERAIPQMRADIEAMRKSIADARAAITDYQAEKEARYARKAAA